MIFSGKTLMNLGLMALTAWFMIAALKWPLWTAIFPVVVGIPIFFIAMVLFFYDLLGKQEDDRGETVEGIEPALVRRRTFSIFLWIIGFFLLVVLVSFPIAIPLYLFLYLKLKGREGWGISLGLAAIGGAGFYGLFVWLLNLPFLEGWVQIWLRNLGIG